MSGLAFPKDVGPVLYREIKCPKCLLLYKTGDRSHSAWYGQAPLLLSCGHAVCESCLLKFNFHKCSVCDEETLWDSRSKKQKHLYVVGLLVDSHTKSNLQSNPGRAKKSVARVIESSPAARSLTRDLCQECNIVKATVQCRKCGIEVCLTCFKKIHSPQAMKKHRPEPVNLTETALSCLLPACQKHPQNTATVLCVSCSENGDSEKFFCTNCKAIGEHRKHKVKDMSLLTQQHMPELQQAMKDLRDSVEHLQDSIKECLYLEEQANQSREYVTMQIRSYMHRIHGLLQIEEEAILTKLHSVHNEFVDTIFKKQSNLEKKAQIQDGVLKHAELLINGEVPSVHPYKFMLEMKRLASASDKSGCLNYYTSYTNIFRVHTKQDLENYIPGCVAVEDIVNPFVPLSDSRLHNLQDGSMVPQEIHKLYTICQGVDIGCDSKDDNIQAVADPLNAMILKEYDAVLDSNLGAPNLLKDHGGFAREKESMPDAKILQDNLDFVRNDIEESLIDICDAVSVGLTPIQNESLPKPGQNCETLLKELSALPNTDGAFELISISDLDMHANRSVIQLKDECKQECAPNLSKTLMDLSIEDLVLNQTNIIQPRNNVVHADLKDLIGNIREPVSEYTTSQPSQELITDVAAKKGNQGSSSSSPKISDIEATNTNSDRDSALGKEDISNGHTVLLSKNPIPALTIKDDNDSEVLISGGSASQLKTEYAERQWEDLGAKPKILTLNKTTEEEKTVNNPIHKADSISSLLSCESSAASSLSPAKKTALLMEEHVRVTHVDSPSLFYVQRSADFEKIHKLNERLNKYARRPIKIKDAVPVVGKQYLGRFTLDGTWYRAQVISVKPTTQEVEVLYVDYGNREILKTSRLYDCPPQYDLDKLPSFCLTCGLWQILPGKGEIWDSESITTFTELVKDTTLQLYVISYEAEKCWVDVRRPTSTVGIVNDLPVSIREIFIFLELGVYDNYSPQDKYNKNAGLLSARKYSHPEIPFSSDGVAVLLSAVVSPRDFHLQLASSIEYFCQLMEEIQAHYNSRHIDATLDWNVYAPKIGMSCVAKYSGDGRWHRAIIEDLPGKRKVDIKFIDIGKKERVKHKQLRKIKDKFVYLPAQAIPCSLTGIEPRGESWPDNIASLMENLFDTQDIMALFHSYEDGVCTVSLKVMIDDEEIDIGEQLILANEAQDSSRRAFGKQHISNEENGVKVNASGNKLFHKKLSPHLGGEVKYLDTTSPTCIHLQLASRIASFKELQSKLKQEMQDCVSPEDFSPCFGDLYAVRQKTETFARVKILEIKEPHAKVHFIDCGGIQQLKLSELLPLPDKFSRIENICTVVSLVGILPPGGQGCWPGITVDRLKELLSKLDKLYIKSMGGPKRHPEFEIKVIPVELGYTYENLGGAFEVNSKVYVSINNWLVEEGLALPDHSKSSSIFNKSGNVDEQDIESFSEFQEEMFFRDLQIFCEEQEKPAVLDEKDTPCKTIENWLPCPLPDKPKFSAVATYVDNSGFIYLQPVSNGNTLDIISKGQTMQFSGSVPSDNDLCWSPGDPVIAKFFLDKKWYRATVLKLMDNGDVFVQFVDYGNTDTVKIADLRRDIIFGQIPIQCLRAALHGIEPNTADGAWPVKVLDFLHQTVVEKECLVTVMEKPHPDKYLQVQLSLVTLNIDVISLLVDKLKLCRRIKPKRIVEVIEEQDSCDVIVEDDEFQELLNFPTVNLPPISLPFSSEKILVKITAIKDPAHVYISPVFKEEPCLSKYEIVLKAETDAYKNFFTFINEDPNKFEPVKDPQIGGIYLGMFPTQEWYRVQVVNKLSKFVTALFVDTGNLEDIPIVHLKVCPAKGRTIPAQAVGVELYRIEPPQDTYHWSEEAMTAMIDCLMGSEDMLFRAAILDLSKPPRVKLYNRDTEDLAYTSLITKGLITVHM